MLPLPLQLLEGGDHGIHLIESHAASPSLVVWRCSPSFFIDSVYDAGILGLGVLEQIPLKLLLGR